MVVFELIGLLIVAGLVILGIVKFVESYFGVRVRLPPLIDITPKRIPPSEHKETNHADPGKQRETAPPRDDYSPWS